MFFEEIIIFIVNLSICLFYFMRTIKRQKKFIEQLKTQNDEYRDRIIYLERSIAQLTKTE
jgi:hypothetical protein